MKHKLLAEAFCAIALGWSGCRQSTPRDASPQSAVLIEETVAVQTSKPDSTSERSATPPVARGAPPQGVAPSEVIPWPPVKERRVLSVGMVLDSVGLVGAHVRVWGTCQRRGAGVAFGAPPVSRSDWELAGTSRGVWVSGRRPPRCTIEAGANMLDTIAAVVRTDAPRMLDGSTRTRRYLVLGG